MAESEIPFAPKYKNETGNRYGYLTVLKFGGSYRKETAMWLCQCDCGNTKIIRGSALRNGTSRSCGCRSKIALSRGTRTLPFGESAFNVLMQNYAKNSRKKNLEWQLNRDEFRHIIKQPCYYCHIEPTQIYYRGNGFFTYNGIDRVDNNVGYIIGNIVPSCYICNRAKSNLTLNEFMKWIDRIRSI